MTHISFCLQRICDCVWKALRGYDDTRHKLILSFSFFVIKYIYNYVTHTLLLSFSPNTIHYLYVLPESTDLLHSLQAGSSAINLSSSSYGL